MHINEQDLSTGLGQGGGTSGSIHGGIASSQGRSAALMAGGICGVNHGTGWELEQEKDVTKGICPSYSVGF